LRSRSQAQGHGYVLPPAFGRPLKDSLKYSNAQISTADANGKLYVWGHIPVMIMAKWWVYIITPFFVPRIGADVMLLRHM
jgi:hypothetical protein